MDVCLKKITSHWDSKLEKIWKQSKYIDGNGWKWMKAQMVYLILLPTILSTLHTQQMKSGFE